jgi:peptide/nickel transport system substrate-binding protein
MKARTRIDRGGLAAWLLALGALVGAAGIPAAPAQEPAKPQWTVAVADEADTLDPPGSPAFTAEQYMFHVYDGLTGVEGSDLKPVGLLAERWENVSPTLWRFHLRKGVKFHNGDPFDAEDVKYSMAVYLDPKNRRYSYAQAIQRVDVHDPYTVDIVTAKPSGPLLTNLARLFILPRTARDKMGVEAFAQRPVGTGPYRLVEWVRDQRLVLEANDAYWRGTARPKRLVFRPIKDPGTRAAELRTGGVDIIVAPPVPQLDLLDRGETQVTPVKGGRIIIYPFHVKQPPFDNLKARQAANLAVNREAIVRTVLGGHGVVLAGPLVAGWLGYDPALPPLPYDPARAKQLLAEAGYPQGFDTQWTISSGAFLKDTEIAEAVAGQLRQVGIRVSLVPTDRAKLQKDAIDGTFQGITSVAWGTQFESDLMLSWFLTRPHLTTPRIADLLEAGRAEVDVDKRRPIYQDVYRTVREEALWLFVHAQDELWAKRRALAWAPYSVGGGRAYTYYFQVPGGR